MSISHLLSVPDLNNVSSLKEGLCLPFNHKLNLTSYSDFIISNLSRRLCILHIHALKQILSDNDLVFFMLCFFCCNWLCVPIIGYTWQSNFKNEFTKLLYRLDIQIYCKFSNSLLIGSMQVIPLVVLFNIVLIYKRFFAIFKLRLLFLLKSWPYTLGNAL